MKELERDIYRTSAGVTIGLAIWVTSLGAVNPFLIFVVAVLLHGFFVGFARSWKGVDNHED
jgi:hypothetical protein